MIDQIERLFHSKRFAELCATTVATNQWTTSTDILYAVDAIKSEFLDRSKLDRFIARHKINSSPQTTRVGVIAAGNLPLVGFADMFYSLLCGCSVAVKPSSKDPLMRVFEELDRVTIAESIEQLGAIDALLAMGSDQTCAMLKKQFPYTQMLLRGSMHSIAVLTGDETSEELNALADDCFYYCSRGCRSVTHLYLPLGYRVETLKFAPRQMPPAWCDCYRYERARAVLAGQMFVDGGYYLLTPQQSQAASVIGYSFYDDANQIPTLGIQHIAKRGNFGYAQRPTLDDFANGRSVVDFLKTVSN